MHRSGTSALTRILSLAGAKLPKSLMSPSPANATGFWESVALKELHDKLLAELGSSWIDWRILEVERLTARRLDHIKSEIARVVEAEYGDAPFFVVKDPRICRFAGLFMESLARLGIDVHPVIPVRNPLEVSDSLGTKYGNVSSISGSLLWLHYVLQAEVSTRQSSRAVVSFESLLQDWKSCLGRITEQTGLSWPNSADDISGEVTRFLDPAHRHHVREADDLLGDAVFKPWIGTAYGLLRQLERRPDDPQTLAALDGIRTEFNHCGAMLREMFSRVDGEAHPREEPGVALRKNEAFKGTQRERTDARKQAEDDSLRVEAGPGRVEKGTKQRDTVVATLQQSLATAEARASELQADQARRESETDDLRKALDASKIRARALASNLKHRALRVKVLETAAVATEAIREDLLAKLSARDELAKEYARQIAVAQLRSDDSAKTLLLRNALVKKMKDDLVGLERRTEQLRQNLVEQTSENERLNVQIIELEKEAQENSHKLVLPQQKADRIGGKRRRAESTRTAGRDVSSFSVRKQRRGRKARARRQVG
jgi:hypothetical protein